MVLIKSVDGLGHIWPKINTYRIVNKSTPTLVHAGFKLFFTEDRRHRLRCLLTGPSSVLMRKAQRLNKI